MRNFACGLTTAVALAAAPLAAGAMATPAVGSAAAPLNCPGGEYWEPSTNTCMPLGQGPTPLDCPPGEWWNPFGNACRPLGQV